MVLLVAGHNWMPAAISHASVFFFFTMLERTLFVEDVMTEYPEYLP